MTMTIRAQKLHVGLEGDAISSGKERQHGSFPKCGLRASYWTGDAWLTLAIPPFGTSDVAMLLCSEIANLDAPCNG